MKEEDQKYITRYEHADFVLVPKKPLPIKVDDDLDADDLINIFDADNVNEKKSALKKEKKLKQVEAANATAKKSIRIDTPEEKLALLSGKEDFYFKANVAFDQYQILVAGGANQNNRDHMEDRLDISKLSSVSDLADDDLMELGENTTHELQKQCVISTARGGSTYVNTTIDLFNCRILTTNLGDSEAWFAYEDAEGKTQLVQLHSCLHHVDNSDEVARLKRAGRKLTEYTTTHQDGTTSKYLRLGEYGGLLVTRSLGDHRLEREGLVHQPSLHIFSYAQ